jgi:hypothetical membrane protein
MSIFLPGRVQISNQVLALSGPGSAAVFALTNIVFTAFAADGYSCGQQMVSKLGARGAAHACVFNLFSFVLPGLLVVALAFGLKRELRVLTAPTLLGSCGAFLIVVGLFPVGFTLLGDSTHVTAALLCGLSFVVSASLLSSPMRKHPSFFQLSRLTPWLVFLLILHLAGQVIWAPEGLLLPPGWTERLNLVGCFAWLTFAGLSLSTSLRQKRDWNRFPSVPLSSDRLEERFAESFRIRAARRRVSKDGVARAEPQSQKAARGHGGRMGYASLRTPTATIKAGGCRSEA